VESKLNFPDSKSGSSKFVNIECKW